MKKIIVLLLVSTVYSYCYSQSDTIIVKSQKGFLFLSSYNFNYDESNSEDKPLGFHDFFYPSHCLDIKCFLDSNKSTVFKNGVRVEYFKKRNLLKKKATIVECKDVSQCYGYDHFLIIPVIIDCKVYDDNFPLICNKKFYELQANGSINLRFEYQHKVIVPLDVKIFQAK